MKKLIAIAILLLSIQMVYAQVIPQKFGKGIQVYGKDSSFYMKIGLRFQKSIY